MNAFSFDEDPGIDGPDYIALVIEWDEDEVTTVMDTARPVAPAARTLATVVGALAALAFATWGIHRLHAA